MLLRETRGIGFEDVVEAIADGRLLADLAGASLSRPGQNRLVVEIEGYAVVVPYVIDGETIPQDAFPGPESAETFPWNLSGEKPMQKRKILENPPFLNDEERELIEAVDIETAEMLSGPDWELRREVLERAARLTANPPKVQISTRLSKHDLSRLKAIAMQKGIPYQTLLGSIVHQYVEGQLKEIS
ncbi:MAG: hypothetical protein KDJ48_09155 [Nitratireductor sp.]|nr:hypothetical protein [Nitratireductor sp.]